MGTVVIKTTNLNKWYGKLHALRNLNLEVRRGEVFGFLGPNGAGKTTFTKLVLGLIKPTSGLVQMFGSEVHGQPRRALRNVGLIPDQFGFYPNLTGRAHLDFYARLYGIPRGLRASRIGELLELVSMVDRADTKVKTYSHGMRQRIVIAQALLNEPELILFDEPTTGLDPKGAFEIRQLIKGLAKGGVTIFLSSHILHEVEEVCTRVGILHKGRLLRVATIPELRRELRGAGGALSVAVAGQGLDGKVIDALRKTPGVVSVAPFEKGLRFYVKDESLVGDATTAIVRAGGKLTLVQPEEMRLEEIFLRLTSEMPEGEPTFKDAGGAR